MNFLNAMRFLDIAALKQAHMLWAGPPTSLKLVVLQLPLLYLSCAVSHHVFSHGISCVSVICEIHVGIVRVHVEYLMWKVVLQGK
jgi:hypothetical protein